MITTDQALEQIQRLYQHKGYPRGEEGRACLMDLVKELMQVENVELAIAIMESDFLDEATPDTPCPTKSQIRKAITSRLEEFRPDPECKQCQGIGHYDVIRDGKSTGWAKCRCWARRPAPVYKRDPAVAEELAGAVAQFAAAKRERTQ